MTTQSVRTRFAPSPTGYMHIGNLRTALYAYLYARANEGTFILRIEDTDQNRFVEGAVDLIYRTLEAAGISHDEGPDVGGDFGPYVQSERKPIYLKYAQQLVDQGDAYYCFCKNDEAPQETEDTFSGYNRACRNLDPGEAAKRVAAGEAHVIRQRVPLTGTTTYHDAVYGDISVENETLDDQVLIKGDGMPTYNFANVVDDHLMAVTHIIRGDEFLSSTPKHVLLYQAFGWQAPGYIHLPPVMGKSEDGSISKLSKRHGATSFEQLVDMGYLPEALVNYIALLGWSPKSNQEIFTMDELKAHFGVDGLSKSPSVFDYDKLNWMNGEYLAAMEDADFAQVSRPYIKGEPAVITDHWDDIAALLKNRISRISEVQEMVQFLVALPDYDVEDYKNKRNKMTPEKALTLLPELSALVAGIEDWTADGINHAVDTYCQEKEVKKGVPLWPLRIAISGQKVTPGGATEILLIIGKEEALRRIAQGIEKLQGQENHQ